MQRMGELRTGTALSELGLYGLWTGPSGFYDRQSRQGFYIEPQGQLSLNRYSAMDYLTSAGLRVHSDSYDSTIGRIGLVLGHNSVRGDRSTNLYGKIMYEKEFGGDVTYRLNGVPVQEDFGGHWWTYGLGVTGQFGAGRTYYLEVHRSGGNRFDQEWQVNAGLRWSFQGTNHPSPGEEPSTLRDRSGAEGFLLRFRGRDKSPSSFL